MRTLIKFIVGKIRTYTYILRISSYLSSYWGWDSVRLTPLICCVDSWIPIFLAPATIRKSRFNPRTASQQWAAVAMRSAEMMLPPQKWTQVAPVNAWKETCHGNSPVLAFDPPTMLTPTSPLFDCRLSSRVDITIEFTGSPAKPMYTTNKSQQ